MARTVAVVIWRGGNECSSSMGVDYTERVLRWEFRVIGKKDIKYNYELNPTVALVIAMGWTLDIGLPRLASYENIENTTRIPREY